MHFLSHYYCELPNNKPYFVVGLIIPDLFENFSKTYNSVIRKSVISDNVDLEMIHEGILSHYRADKGFHNSKSFIEHLAMTVQAFIKAGLSRERLRLSIIAHVAVELMIDRQILMQHESICYDFYEAVGNASEKGITLYFGELGLKDEAEAFLIRFRFFKQRKFLFSFNELENIVFGLSRIYLSATGVEFTGEEKKKFVNALNNIDAVMRYSWQEILKA